MNATANGNGAGPVSASAATRTAWWRQEDWLAVFAGVISLAAILVGWRPSLPTLKWAASVDLGKVFGSASFAALGGLGVAMLVLALPAMLLMRARAGRFMAGFVVVFGLAWVAQILAGNARVNALGVEYVIFGLLLGLAVNHAVGVPDWLREAVRTEFYIKTGLVILGATILFQEMMQAGVLGLVQGALVVTVVWYVAFWLARRFRVDDELGVMLSSAVAICGVSAAIATCGAIQGDRKKLSYVTSLVLIVAVPMMVAMPWIAKSAGMPELVAGAWLGGTLDTSGSVVAAGQLISEKATKAGVIVKLSQNVLIGLVAFGLSIWWASRASGANGGQSAERPTARVIWERFPKFVLGFMAASLAFSFVVAPGTVTAVKPALNGLRGFWFALAFVSIGLETNFREIVTLEGGRPALAFLVGQAFNVFWTLLLAWLLFGGVLVAVPAIR